LHLAVDEGIQRGVLHFLSLKMIIRVTKIVKPSVKSTMGYLHPLIFG
jgi:hypothetical protein